MAKVDVKAIKGTSKNATAEVTQPNAEPQENAGENTSDEVTEGTGEPAQSNDEINKSETAEPAVTEPASSELTDGASEKTEDNDETADEASAEPQENAGGKVVVTYVGGGTYRDRKGEVWANEDKGRFIKKSRVYTKEQYDGRKDLHFMVQYGSMTAVVAE